MESPTTAPLCSTREWQPARAKIVCSGTVSSEGSVTDFEPLRYGDLRSKVEQTWETKEGVYTRPAMAVSLRVLSKKLPIARRATNEVLTANDSSVGNSGGTADVIINEHSTSNL